jgi:PKD repeat protein
MIDMRLIIVTSLCCLVTLVRAQITITQAAMPSANDTIRYSSVAPAGVNLNIQQKGASQSWDYSKLVANGQDIYRYAAANNTPYLLYFFNQVGLKTADSLGAGPVMLKNIYSFFTKNSTVFKQEGIGYSYQGFPLAAQNKDDDEIYQFPLKYGDSDVSTYNFRFVIPGNLLTFVQAGVRTNVVDGWGSIVTPYKTYPNVLRVKTLVNGTDSLITQFGRVPIPRRQVIYKWLSADEKIPVLEMTGTETGGNFTATQIRYRDKYLGLVSPLRPQAGFSISKSSGFVTVDTFTLTDRSRPFATGWNWQITPGAGVSFVSGTTAGSRNPRVVFRQAGLYNVSLVVSNTFGTDDTTAANAISVQYGLSVDNFNLSEKYFYPNPARGQITMVKPGTLRIFDAAGRCVLQCKVSASQVVSIHALPVGVYTLKVNDSAAMPLLHY